MSKNLTKTELVSRLSRKVGVTAKEAANILEALSAIITEEVVSGVAVTLPDVAKFSPKERPARQVRNPATGESIMRDADKTVKITASKALREALLAA